MIQYLKLQMHHAINTQIDKTWLIYRVTIYSILVKYSK